MVCTYEEYLKRPKAITFEKMQTIHTEMIAEIGTLLYCTGQDALYNNCKSSEIFPDRPQAKLRRILSNTRKLCLVGIEASYL